VFYYGIFCRKDDANNQAKILSIHGRHIVFYNEKVTAIGHRELHWLPIRARVLYKLCDLMYDVHSGRSPAYIEDIVTARCSASQRPGLSSASTTDYIKLRLSTKFGERAFSYAGPHAWNDLPDELRSTTNAAGNFKKTSEDSLL